MGVILIDEWFITEGHAKKMLYQLRDKDSMSHSQEVSVEGKGDVCQVVRMKEQQRGWRVKSLIGEMDLLLLEELTETKRSDVMNDKVSQKRDLLEHLRLCKPQKEFDL